VFSIENNGFIGNLKALDVSNTGALNDLIKNSIIADTNKTLKTARLSFFILPGKLKGPRS